MSSFSLFHWFILFVIGFVLFGIFRGKSKGETMYCRTCGHRGPTRTVTNGSLAIEIVLWLCLIVPGLIYSIWRLTTRHQACSACNSAQVIPPNAPAALDAIAPDTDSKTCPFCAETIKKAAVLCRHCGKELPASA